MSDNQIPFVPRGPMRCDHIEALVDDYVDGELSADQQLHFERHTGGCAQCRKLVQDTESILESVRLLDEAPLPTEVGVRLRDTLEQKTGHRFSMPSPLRPIFFKSS